MHTLSVFRWPLLVAAVALAGIVALNIQPYDWNVSGLVHMDETLANQHRMPSGFVILKVPAYDGAQYYQVARNLPLLVQPKLWPFVRAHSPGSYAYQRFLLPLAAFVLSAGQERALPYALLLLNLASLLAACALVLRYTKGKWLYALALALCPAAMVGLHFSLAEPLTIVILTAFLTRFVQKEQIEWIDVLLLSLAVLTREVNILFVGTLALYMLWKKQWRSLAWLAIPALVFLALHSLIFAIFREVPFLWSVQKREFPGLAIVQLLTGMLGGFNRLTLSSIALFLGFVLPSVVWLLTGLLRDKRTDFLTLGGLVFLAVMINTSWYIWGSITSIGRVITPVYPLVILALSARDTRLDRAIALAVMLIGLGAALGLALTVHPYFLS